jgi:hypothetical protein
MSERNVRVVVHSYRAEQAVEFFPASGIDRKARGQYTVVRLLPIEGAIPQYRPQKQNRRARARGLRERTPVPIDDGFLALIFGPTIALEALKALHDFPQQNTDREAVANPRHDGALIIRNSPAYGDVEQLLTLRIRPAAKRGPWLRIWKWKLASCVYG